MFPFGIFMRFKFDFQKIIPVQDFFHGITLFNL